METKALVVRTWDDLIFASRNREYGAYPLRKAYSRNLMVGLGVSTALIAILFLAADLNPDKKIKALPPPITDRSGDVRLDPPPVFEARPPAQPIRRTEPTPRTNTTIRVVSQPVEDTPIVDDPVISSQDGSLTGTDAPLIGDDIGTSDIPVVAPVMPEVVTYAEVMPAYEGGYEEMIRFLKSKLRYPATDRRIGTEGTVFVSFIVNGDGSIRDVKVVRGISATCDKEAVRVISLLPGWKGGRQNGNPVAVRMVLPVKFSLAR
jgi:protein TonB